MANTTVYPFGQGGQLPSGYPIVDDLFTGGADKALSAQQGKIIGNELFRDGNVVQVINLDQCGSMPLWATSSVWRTSSGNNDRLCRYFSRDERWASLYVTANPNKTAFIFQLTELPDPSQVQDRDPTQGLILSTSITAGENAVIVLDDDCEYIVVNETPDGPGKTDYRPSYLAGCTTVEGGKSRLDVLEDTVNHLAEHPAVNLALEITFERLGKIFDNTQAGDATINSPCIIRPVHENPIGKYYMYYGMDHGGGASEAGIKLAYSNDLLHWTVYGIVLTAKDQFSLSSRKETETPWVIWDKENSRYLMYWHSIYSTGEAPAYDQTTYISESVDGINWTYIKPALSIPMNHIVGNGHNGYFKVYPMDGIFYGFSLLGGGDDSYAGRHFSTNGLDWITEQCSSVISSEGWRFCALGRYFSVRSLGKAASGFEPKTTNIGIQEVCADYRTPISGRSVFVKMDEDLGETQNIRAISGFIDDGNIYIVYNCASNDLSMSAFFLGKIKTKEY